MSVVGVREAQAQFFQSATGLTDPVTTVTFDEHAFGRGTPITTQFEDVGDAGVTFSPAIYYNFILNDFINISGGRVAYASNNWMEPFSIHFGRARTSAAFAFVSNSGTLFVQALRAGQVVAEGSGPTSTTPDANMFGFADVGMGGFDELRLRTDITFGSHGFIVDTIQIGPAAPPPCVADVDNGSGTGTPDGGVTIDDLLYYIVIFEQGLLAADLDDGSGTGTPDNGVTIDDLLYYLHRFEAGC